MHDTTEEYLESILAIEEEGVVPMSARLVERLGLSAAAVSATVGRLIEHGYVDVIGLEWEKVHREADRWEHAISADVEEKLVELLGDPATCPHGNPIPGSKHKANAAQTIPLARSVPGPITVQRVNERLETDDDGIGLIAAAHMMPGNEVTVVEVGDDGVTVDTETGRHTLPKRVADNL